jgi:hypothetical protein
MVFELAGLRQLHSSADVLHSPALGPPDNYLQRKVEDAAGQALGLVRLLALTCASL